MITEAVTQALLWSGAVSCGLWLAVCWLFFGLLRMPVYHPFSLYLVYHFFGFVLRPFVVAARADSFIWFRIGYQPWPDDVAQAAAVANLALLSCTVGAYWVARRRKHIPLLPPTAFIINRTASFYSAAALLALLGLYSIYIAYGGAGVNAVNAFDSVLDDAGGLRLQGISGYQLALAEALPVLCLILLLSNAPSAVAYSATGAFIVARLYVGAQRLSFVVVIAAALFNSLIRRRRRLPTAGMVALMLAGYVAFDMLGHDRQALRRIAAGEASIATLWDNYASVRSDARRQDMDVVEFETATAAIDIVDTYSGNSWGTQYLRVFLWPIPRQLWADKPVFTNIVNLNAYGHRFQNLTHSLYADLYMALSYPAVLVGMVLLGWLMAQVYELAGRTTRPAAYMFFWVFLIYMPTVLRDGGAVFIYFWGFSMLFALALLLAGGVSLKRAAAPEWAAPAKGGRRPGKTDPRFVRGIARLELADAAR